MPVSFPIAAEALGWALSYLAESLRTELASGQDVQLYQHNARQFPFAVLWMSVLCAEHLCCAVLKAQPYPVLVLPLPLCCDPLLWSQGGGRRTCLLLCVSQQSLVVLR